VGIAFFLFKEAKVFLLHVSFFVILDISEETLYGREEVEEVK
jgi:hypothetical protein